MSKYASAISRSRIRSHQITKRTLGVTKQRPISRYQVFDLHTVCGLNALVDKIAKKRIVWMGENHKEPFHKKNELEIAAALQERNPFLTIVNEMPKGHQKRANSFLVAKNFIKSTLAKLFFGYDTRLMKFAKSKALKFICFDKNNQAERIRDKLNILGVGAVTSALPLAAIGFLFSNPGYLIASLCSATVFFLAYGGSILLEKYTLSQMTSKKGMKFRNHFMQKELDALIKQNSKKEKYLVINGSRHINPFDIDELGTIPSLIKAKVSQAVLVQYADHRSNLVFCWG